MGAGCVSMLKRISDIATLLCHATAKCWIIGHEETVYAAVQHLRKSKVLRNWPVLIGRSVVSKSVS